MDAATADLRERLQRSIGAAYVLGRELGGGGMARVFMAEEAALGRQVVIKVLPPDLSGAVSAERFRREIQLCARLRHPHVVPLLAAGEADTRGASAPPLLYYTMPYVEGESLRTRLARIGALPLPEAVRLLRDIADALAYAHTQGVVHRDLKPENILLEHGHAVVADFGVAKALTSAAFAGGRESTGLTTAGLAVGTPAYMAPEQALADPAADQRVDLYALGCIAYEALAGAHPFDAVTPQSLIAAHIAVTPRPLAERRSDVPADLGALVTRLLEKRADDRPGTAAEVVRALDALDLRGGDSASGVAASGAAASGAAASGAAAAVRPSRRHQPGRRVFAAMAAVAVLAAGSWLAARGGGNGGAKTVETGGRPAAPAGITSVAVLPLVNVGGDTAQEYFADGLTDELTDALSRVQGLRVASRTSAFAFKERRDADVREISRRLNVDAVLEGTVRRAGQRLKVTAQLTDAGDGLGLWSNSYERELADVFAVQDDIARAIVRALEARLGARPLGAVASQHPRDLEAYDLYLRAEYLFRKLTEPDLRRSLALYEAAVAKDSTFAAAWAGISRAWAWLADDWLAPREAYPKAKAAALRAVASDSTLPDAHGVLASALLFGEWEFDAAERAAGRALALGADADTYFDYAHLLDVTGRLDSALIVAREAQRLDPLHPQRTTAVGDFLVEARRYEDALVEYRRALELEPEYVYALVGMANAHTAAGRPAAALAVLERTPASDSRVRLARARAHATLGRRAEAIAIAREMESESRRRYVRAEGIASIYAALGDHDAAFRWLERAFADRSAGLLWLRSLPWWAPLNSDPRFDALVRRVGLP